MNAAVLAAFALSQMIAAPMIPPPGDDAIAVSLCSGGEIAIPLRKGDTPQKRECDQKGCHAGTCREKDKLKPRISS
ncbi:MAG: hypothetical protein WBA51_15605 [Erythrobacter sp.]